MFHNNIFDDVGKNTPEFFCSGVYIENEKICSGILGVGFL
jgi:hypothetical protein